MLETNYKNPKLQYEDRFLNLLDFKIKHFFFFFVNLRNTYIYKYCLQNSNFLKRESDALQAYKNFFQQC